MAAAAVYAANKLLKKKLTQRQLVTAVSPIVEITIGKLGRYNCELVDANIEQYDANESSKTSVH